ncbi:MAG: cobalamin-dependent protein [Eubacterium sp.]|nr:cobalamin-dependent protein [Eubacterium sp.]
METAKMEVLQNLQQAVENGKSKETKKYVQEAIEFGLNADTIVNECLLFAMGKITESFTASTSFVPEVILTSRAMNVATVLLEEHFGKDSVNPVGTVVAATIKGDVHDIGLNLVCMMLRNYGLKVYNMGCDIAADAIIKKAEEVNADIICVSAMLTTTMPQIQGLIKLLENKRLRDKYTVMIGGAPVTERYAKRIGADIYTSTAVEAGKAARVRALEIREKEAKAKK